MLVHAIDESRHYCIVALVNHGLCEEVEGEYLSVLGRACGDRVCVVDARNASAKKDPQKNLRTFLATTANEALHCFGLDHCITWQRLMNSQQVDEHECLFLSPLNLKKLVHAILPSGKVKTNDELVNRYVIDRYKGLGDTLKNLGYPKDATWSYRKADV